MRQSNINSRDQQTKIKLSATIGEIAIAISLLFVSGVSMGVGIMQYLYQ